MVRKSDLKEGQMRQRGKLGKSRAFCLACKDDVSLPTAVAPQFAVAFDCLHLVSENSYYISLQAFISSLPRGMCFPRDLYVPSPFMGSSFFIIHVIVYLNFKNI